MTIKARRGTDAQRTGITFEDGEICWANDTFQIFMGDGSTSGGLLLASRYVVFNKQTGTSYTVQGSDNGKIVTLFNASAITVTIPQASTEALAEGFHCGFIQIGSGQVTFQEEGSDVIISDTSYKKLKGQGAPASLMLHDAGSPNTYLLTGSLVA